MMAPWSLTQGLGYGVSKGFSGQGREQRGSRDEKTWSRHRPDSTGQKAECGERQNQSNPEQEGSLVALVTSQLLAHTLPTLTPGVSSPALAASPALSFQERSPWAPPSIQELFPFPC